MKEKCKQFNANALERLLVYLYECRQAVRPNLCEFKFQKFFQRKSCTIGCILPLLVLGVLLTGNIGIVRAQDFSSKSPSGHKLYYTISGNNATVEYNEKYKEYKYEVEIPSYVRHKGKKYTVSKIGRKCFYECKKIVSIKIPATVTTIGPLAFLGCETYAVYYGGTLEDWIRREMGHQINLSNFHSLYVEGNNKVVDLVIPKSVSVVPEEAFSDCSIRSVVFHESVNYIDEAAFYGCHNLENVEFRSPYTQIRKRAFMFCKFKSVDLPSRLTVLESEAFSYCYDLKRVNLGDNLEIIGAAAFKRTPLEGIVLPATLKMIADSAFSRCTDLKQVINHSPYLTIKCGSEDNGRVAKYAEEVIDMSKGVPVDVLTVQDSVVDSAWTAPTQIVGVKHFGVMKTDSTGSSQMIIDTVFDEVRIFEGETGEYYQCKYRSYVHSSARRYLPGDVVEFYNAEGELITRDYDDLLTRDYFPYDGVRQYGKDKGLPEVEAAADIACGMYYEGKSQRREAYQSYMKAYKVCPSLTMAKEKADGILQSMKEEQNQIRRQIQVEHEIAAAEFSAAMNSLSASLQGLADAVGSFSTSSTSRTSTTTAKPGSTANPQPKSGSTAKPTAPKPQKKCTYCNGTGESIEHTNAPGLVQEDKWCDKCRKVVHWWHSHQRCPICKGKGYKN